jgi:hypothetical protein
VHLDAAVVQRLGDPAGAHAELQRRAAEAGQEVDHGLIASGRNNSGHSTG